MSVLGKMLIERNKAFYVETTYSPPKEATHLSKATVLSWENTGVGKSFMGRTSFWVKDGLLAPYLHL